MKTDRELMELVGRAIGLHTSPLGMLVYEDGTIEYYERKPSGSLTPKFFEPLQDNGDALRLAVMLGMIVVIQDSGFVCAEIPGFDPVGEYEWSEAATRRAIVRAAAQVQLLKESK